FDTRGNDKQTECCRAWLDPNATDIVYGGAKGGAKSFTGCKLIFGDAMMYPETHYFIARNELSALRKFTIPSIHECFDDWGLNISQYAKFNGQDNYYSLYNKSRVYLLDAAWMPSDPLYMRFGSMQFTRGWGEETGEWHEAAKNNLMASVGRWKNDTYGLAPKFLQTCNPSKNYLYRDYYKPWKDGTLPKWKRFIQALPTDNKMLSPEYILNLERTLNNNERQRLLYGNWEYDNNPAALIDYEKACDVFTNTHVPEGRKCITADIARLGGDRVVIIEWNGMRGKVTAYKREKLTVTTTNIEAARSRNAVGKSDVLVDSDGMGSGVEDFGGFKGFVNNARALPDPKKPVGADGKPVVENFDNLKSQCGFRMAEIINANGLYLECEDWMKPLIIEELEQVQQKALDSELKRGLLPKDKVKELIGRSPDFWDAILMRVWFELKPQVKLAMTTI
ncbi:MAG: phage portal protein, partial [Chitinophagaceae bacterium]|nr:phage portal protein [Chitinophagaceae bacterium]